MPIVSRPKARSKVLYYLQQTIHVTVHMYCDDRWAVTSIHLISINSPLENNQTENDTVHLEVDFITRLNYIPIHIPNLNSAQLKRQTCAM
jgi:hypothetical protein